VKSPGGFGLLAGGEAPATSIDFAALFPTAYQVLQSDRGLSYGAVMRADPGNTSGVSFALTGATPAVPVPIWIKITSFGRASIYYDGLGITPTMTNVVVSDSVPIVLADAGSGMAITPGVGSQVTGNIWRATCSGLNDQSGNGRHAIQLTPSKQPLVAVGRNGKPEILFGGGSENLRANFLPPAGTMGYLVYRIISGGSFNYIVDSNPGAGSNGYSIFINGGAHSVFGYSGAYLPGGDIGLNAYNRTVIRWNAAASSIKLGSNPITSGDVGPLVPLVGMRTLGCRSDESSGANIGLFAIVHCPPQPYAAADAAINAAPSGYGPGIAV